MTDNAQQDARIRNLLVQEQARLRADLKGSAASAATVELDQTRQGRLSRMDAMQQQAMARASTQRMEQRLRQIAVALRRLDEGDYGHCIDCGDSILAARLEFDPCATRCIACAGRREA